jgi:acetyltransferase-like isoleucine patch superfamily enzyme
VRLGPGVKLISADHDILDFDKHVSEKPIEIESFCWLGANVVVLPGVKLAEHTIVAAGAVVTKSFLEGDCVIAGVPARVVKKIDPYTGRRSVEI